MTAYSILSIEVWMASGRFLLVRGGERAMMCVLGGGLGKRPSYGCGTRRTAAARQTVGVPFRDVGARSRLLRVPLPADAAALAAKTDRRRHLE